MAIGNLYRIYKTSFNGVSALPGIQQRSLDPQTALRLNQSTGEPFASFAAIQSQDPVLSLVSTDAEILLDEVGLGGLAIDNAAGCEAFYVRTDEDANPTSGSVHIKKTARKGSIILDRLNCLGDSEATVEFMFHAVKDGSNDIWATSLTESRPVNDTLLEKAKFAKFRFDTGGGLTERDGIRGFTLNFNVQMQKHKEGGEKQPQKNFYARGNPVFELPTSNIEEFDSANISLDGLAVDDWDCYLQAIDAEDQEVAVGLNRHMKIHGSRGLLYLGPSTVDQEDAAGTSIFFQPLQKGDTPSTDWPVLFTKDQVIP